MKKFLFYFSLALLLAACKMGDEQEKDNAFQRKTEKVLDYFPNGVKKMEGELVNGKRHGIWKAYYENGFLWSEGKYWYGKRKGFSSIYYKDGKKKMEGDYENDVKVGVWKIWNKKGQLVKSVNMSELFSQKDSLKLELK